MLIKFRKWLIHMIGAKSGTAITVGSYIDTHGEHGVSITLLDGWTHASARLSPAGAKRIADQMQTWAAAAESNNSLGQWQSVIRYAIKTEAGEVEEGEIRDEGFTPQPT
jgi:hypothetical protein